MIETSMKNNKVEIRVEVDADKVGVLDAFCQATGKHRTDIVLDLLERWADDQVHVATMVLRVGKRNPNESEGHRT